MSQQFFKGSHLAPSLKSPVDRAFRSELLGQIFPLRSVVQYPENPTNGLSLVSARSSTLGPFRVIPRHFTKHIQLCFGDMRHEEALAFCACLARYVLGKLPPPFLFAPSDDVGRKDRVVGFSFVPTVASVGMPTARTQKSQKSPETVTNPSMTCPCGIAPSVLASMAMHDVPPRARALRWR